MDKQLIARGATRMEFKKFITYLIPWFILLGVGLYAMYLVFRYGLNHTNMDNRFAFGLWIYFDLAIIALGAGAFFTGLLLYVFKRHEFKSVINSAVVIGFICYSGAIAALVVDVGQPLRGGRAQFYIGDHLARVKNIRETSRNKRCVNEPRKNLRHFTDSVCIV
jgi:menaquinone reductase, integral membrane subunit